MIVNAKIVLKVSPWNYSQLLTSSKLAFLLHQSQKDFWKVTGSQPSDAELLHLLSRWALLDVKYYQEILQVCELVLSRRHYLLKNKGSLPLEWLLRQLNPTQEYFLLHLLV